MIHKQVNLNLFFVFLVSLIISLFVFSEPIFAQCLDESIANNTFETATSIEIGQEFVGSFCTSDDHDYYTFTVTETTFAVVEIVFGGESITAGLFVSNSTVDNQRIEEFYTRNGDTYRTILGPDQVFHLSLINFGWTADEGDYTLTIREYQCDDLSEPKESTAIVVGQQFTDSLCTSADSDLFTFDAEQYHTYQLDFSADMGSPQLSLFNWTSGQFESDFYANEPFLIKQGGQYAIVVSEFVYHGWDDINYDYQITLNDLGLQNIICDDEINETTILSIGEQDHGSFCEINNYEDYIIDVQPNDSFIFDVDLDTDELFEYHQRPTEIFIDYDQVDQALIDQGVVLVQNGVPFVILEPTYGVSNVLPEDTQYLPEPEVNPDPWTMIPPDGDLYDAIYIIPELPDGATTMTVTLNYHWYSTFDDRPTYTVPYTISIASVTSTMTTAVQLGSSQVSINQNVIAVVITFVMGLFLIAWRWFRNWAA